MLCSGGRSRRKMEKEIDILDGEMQSRWDKMHGENGIVAMLVENFNSMAELRMQVEYGDYLSYACKRLKGEGTDEMKWKIDRLDWQQTAAKIQEEQER